MKAASAETKGGTSAAAPHRLGRYELVSRIGAGGMAEVHLARQRGPMNFEKLVVVKTINPALAAEPEFIQMLLDEARNAALIKHPNVVDVYDLGEEGGRYFIAMEYLPGQPLSKVLAAAIRQRRPLDVFHAARIVADVAAGLEAAHRLRSPSGKPLELVHRDVSPSNIIVQYDGTVKLVDFGVAKARGNLAATARRTLKGKAGYVSPEQIDGKELDGRSDIFSLGIVLWESLTSRRLFRGANDAATLQMIKQGKPRVPSLLRKEVPEDLDQICLRALALDRRQRYQSARELEEALEAFLRDANYYRGTAGLVAYMNELFAAEIGADQARARRAATAPVPALPDLPAAPASAIAGAPSPPDGGRRVPAPGEVRKPATTTSPKASPPPAGEAAPDPLGADPDDDLDTDVKDPIDEARARASHALLPPGRMPTRPPAGKLGRSPTPPAAPATVTRSLPLPPPSADSEPVPLPAEQGSAAEPDSSAIEISIAVDEAATGVDQPMSPPERAPVDAQVEAPEPSGYTEVVRPLPASRGSRRRWAVIGVAAIALVGVGIAAAMQRGGAPSDASAPTAPLAAVVADDPVQPEEPEPALAAPAGVRPSDRDGDGDADLADPAEPVDLDPAPFPDEGGDEDGAAHLQARESPGGAGAGERSRSRDTSRAGQTDDDEVRKRAMAHYRDGARRFVEGDLRGARRAFERTIEVLPDYAPAHRGLGLTYERLGDKRRATRSFEQYLRIAPQAGDAAQIRARLAALGS